MSRPWLFALFAIATAACADPISVVVTGGTAQASAVTAGLSGLTCSDLDMVSGISVGAYAQCGSLASPGSPSNPAIVSSSAGGLSAEVSVETLLGNGQFITAGGNGSASTTETLLISGGQGTGYIAAFWVGYLPTEIGSVEINNSHLFPLLFATDNIAPVFSFQYGEPFPLTVSAQTYADNGGDDPFSSQASMSVTQIQILAEASPFNVPYAGNVCVPNLPDTLECGQVPLATFSLSSIQSVPEPATALLITAGFLAIAAVRRRRRASC